MKNVSMFFLFISIFLNAQEVILYNESNSPLIPLELKCIAIDSLNTTWIGGLGALYSFNGEWSKTDTALGLKDNHYISDIEVSANGTVWSTMGTGLLSSIVYKLMYKESFEWQHIAYDFGVNDPTHLYVQNDTTVFLTLTNNWPNQLGDDGIGDFTKNQHEIINPTSVWGINSAVPLSKDSILVCDWQGVSLFDGSIWKSFNPAGWIPQKAIKRGHETFVIGESINKYENNSYKTYSEINSALSIDSLNITALTVESNNILWLGTDKGVLIKYSDQLELFNLTTTEIYDIAIDQNKNVWFLCEEGCYLFNENHIVDIKTELSTSLNYQLDQNYPNPFNPTTNIRYSLPKSGVIQVEVYNVLGEKVEVVVNKYQQAGTYEVQFDAKNLNSGIYFYRLTSSNYTETKKMIVLR